MGGDGSYTTEQLQHALDVSVAALNDVPYALAYGTLLGFIRNGQMIDGDDDVDIFIESKHFENAVNAIGSRFPEKISLTRSPYFRCFMVEGVQVDLYSVKNIRGQTYDCWEDGVFPSRFMFPFVQRGKFMVPNHSEEILKIIYGEHWKTPQNGKFNYHENVRKSRKICKQARLHLSPLGISCVAIVSTVFVSLIIYFLLKKKFLCQ